MIDRTPTAERATRALEDRIRTGHWQVGQNLPSVRRLAQELGVGVTTAQAAMQALRQKGLIDLEPRRRARVLVRPSGSSMSIGRKRIGILLPSRGGDNPLTAAVPRPVDKTTWTDLIMLAAGEDFAAHGFGPVLIPYKVHEMAPADAAMEVVRAERENLAGVLTVALPHTASMVEVYEELGLPWVTINPLDRRRLHNFVAADNFGAGQTIGRCLLESGRTRIVFLTNPLAESISSREKLQGMLDACLLQGHSLDQVEVLTCPSHEFEHGYRALCQHLDRGRTAPQAIFASGDLMALGAIRALLERNLRVPEDVALIGTTGLIAAETSVPALTVMAQPMQQIGHVAALMLVQMIREGVRRMVGRRIPCQLLVRDSFRPSPQILETIGQEYRQEIANLRSLAAAAQQP